jgi:hypothetical protein
MTPLVELIAITCTPFLIGVVVGYSLRSYVSMTHRLRD